MHDIDRNTLEYEPETDGFEMDGYEFEFEAGDLTGESVFSEEEEYALASELLGVTSEAELEQFLGSLFKKAWRGIRKVGSTIGRVARPLMGVLKPLVKKALPVVGGALGSFVAPGLGTAIGSSLGSAVGNALEMELEGMNPDEMEFETARRIVRIAGQAASQAAQAGPGVNPASVVKAALTNAAQTHVPGLRGSHPGAMASGGYGRSGRWIRRGRKIVLLGV
jgi:uncharacterized protein (DUF697 family)